LRPRTRKSSRSSHALGYVGEPDCVVHTIEPRPQILHSELEASLQAVQEELITVHSKLEKQQQLNEKLENDLVDIEKHQQAQANGTHEARDTLKNAASSDALAGIELGKKSSACISLETDTLKTVLSVYFQGSPARTTPIPFTSNSADASILPIVTSQRDRFRQRNAELEEVINIFGSPSAMLVLIVTLPTGTPKTIPDHNRPPN